MSIIQSGMTYTDRQGNIMPPLDDNLEAPSSDASIGDTPAAPAAATADPPSAAGDTRSMLDVVRDVVKEGTDSPSEAAEAGDPPTEEAPSQEGEAEAAEAAEAELPYYKDPRFQRVVRERKQAREQVRTLEPDATRYRNVQRFLDDNGISADEAAEALQIAALLKHSPDKAWEKLRPIAEQLLTATGGILSPELQERVSKGELSVEAARELSQAQARAKIADQQRSFEEKLRDQRAATEAASAAQNAAVDWVTDRKAKDPNYAAKEPVIAKEIAYLQRQEGIPTTPEGVKSQLNRAYKAVNASLPPVTVPATAKPAVTPVRGGGVASNAARPEPKSMLDVVRAARG